MKTSQKENRLKANRLSIQFNKTSITYNKVSALSVLRTMPYEMLKAYVSDLSNHIKNFGESNDRTLQLLEKATEALNHWEK